MTVIVKSIKQYPARWIAAYLAPLLITYPEQDTCSFDPVSNGHVGFQYHIDINRLGMFAPNATGETKRSSESHEQTRRFVS